MDIPINFFSEGIQFEIENPDPYKVWISDIVAFHGASIGEINYIFCDDDYLHEINVEHLDHDTLTDIITFPLSEPGFPLMSDIFISIDRVGDNAKERNLDEWDELCRVMVHGVLHLVGFQDKGEKAEEMRAKEDEALAKRTFDVPRGTSLKK